MIRIAVRMFATKEHSEDVATLQLGWVNTNFNDVYSFFDSCVDQGLILNFVDKTMDGETDITEYFSMTEQNAQLFESKFQDLSANFSMRKLWNEVGFDTTITLSETDFESIPDPDDIRGILIDKELKTIWGIDFPASRA
jgi:hypothetical protein